MKTLKIKISPLLERVLDQLEAVVIFDNKNCEKSQPDKRTQEDEGKFNDIPTA
jgi:hypothetical protein